jgi:hypothetical protein
MWEAIKNALIGAKDASGIEIPGLPADLGSIGDSAANAAATVTESATGVIEGAAPAMDAVAVGVAGLSETATTAVDSAATVLPDVAGGLIDTIGAK